MATTAKRDSTAALTLGIPLDAAHLFGVVSAIFRGLMMAVTLKYVLLILRNASNRAGFLRLPNHCVVVLGTRGQIQGARQAQICFRGRRTPAFRSVRERAFFAPQILCFPHIRAHASERLVPTPR